MVETCFSAFMISAGDTESLDAKYVNMLRCDKCEMKEYIGFKHFGAVMSSNDVRAVSAMQ